jgi:hypothetical protein
MQRRSVHDPYRKFTIRAAAAYLNSSSSAFAPAHLDTARSAA